MNFSKFHDKIQNRLKESILSLWATSDAEMQQYFDSIIDKEGLMAEPVFQTNFPWEASDKLFAEMKSVFNETFIDALDGIKNIDYRFPKDRNPYKHQVESWDTLINQNRLNMFQR